MGLLYQLQGNYRIFTHYSSKYAWRISTQAQKCGCTFSDEQEVRVFKLPLQRLKKGGFKIAQQTGAKIVPISIEGADEILKDNSLFNLHLNVPVKVRIRKPVDPGDFLGREGGEQEFMDTIARLIAPT